MAEMGIKTLSYPGGILNIYIYRERELYIYTYLWVKPGGIFSRKKKARPRGEHRKIGSIPPGSCPLVVVVVMLVVVLGVIAQKLNKYRKSPTVFLLVPLKIVSHSCCLDPTSWKLRGVCQVCVLRFSEDPSGDFPPGVFITYYFLKVPLLRWVAPGAIVFRKKYTSPRGGNSKRRILRYLVVLLRECCRMRQAISIERNPRKNQMLFRKGGEHRHTNTQWDTPNQNIHYNKNNW